MEVVDVLVEPDAVVAALDPLRSRMLARLAEGPASAASLASALGETRQRIGYHLAQLADRGLVVEVERRRHGGLTERIYEASAAAYAVAPAAMGDVGAHPDRVHDRLSAAYLVALAGRALGEVGALVRGARAAGRPLPTLSIDTSLRFASPADRAAFADELDALVVDLVARHHDEAAPDGRWYRVVAFAHPRPPEDAP